MKGMGCSIAELMGVSPHSIPYSLWEGITLSVCSIMADTCGQVLLGSGLTVLSHPLMYIKVLVQVRLYYQDFGVYGACSGRM